MKFKTPLRSGFLNVGERRDVQEKPTPAFAVTVLLQIVKLAHKGF